MVVIISIHSHKKIPQESMIITRMPFKIKLCFSKIENIKNI